MLGVSIKVLGFLLRLGLLFSFETRALKVRRFRGLRVSKPVCLPGLFTLQIQEVTPTWSV